MIYKNLSFMKIIITLSLIFILVRFYIRYNNTNKMNNLTEGFINQYDKYNNNLSSRNTNNLLYKIFPFNNHYYLKDYNKPVIYKNYQNLPILKMNTDFKYSNNNISRVTYNDKIINYMKSKIFPLEDISTLNSLDTIFKIINSEIDIGFINEEILLKYIHKNTDLIQITEYYKQLNLQLNIPLNLQTNTILEDKNYQPINFSAIGSTYFMDMFFIGKPNDPLNRMSDIKSSITIGSTIEDSIFLKKIISAHQFTNPDIIKITIFQSRQKLIDTFMKDDINYLFLLCHPKDNYLKKLTKVIKVKFIHLKKNLNITFDNKNLNSDNENDNELIQDTMEAADFYEYVRSGNIDTTQLTDQDNILNYGEEKENFNTILKRYIPSIYPKVVNLNYFHTNDNMYSYLETYSIKMILVANNKIRDNYIKTFTNNFINNLDEIKYKIVELDYNIQFENFNNYDFKFNELLVFHKDIPLHKYCKSIYENYGLIKFKENTTCKLQL